MNIQLRIVDVVVTDFQKKICICKIHLFVWRLYDPIDIDLSLTVRSCVRTYVLT